MMGSSLKILAQYWKRRQKTPAPSMEHCRWMSYPGLFPLYAHYDDLSLRRDQAASDLSSSAPGI
jgi:hypothetical protein